MAYLYRHRKMDTGDTFYIGIGCVANYKRAFSKRNNKTNLIYA